MIAKLVFDMSWINDINPREAVVFIAEGLFMYFTEVQVKELFIKLQKAFPCIEMLFESISIIMSKNTKYYDSVPKTGAVFKLGKDIGKLIFGVNVKNEWNLFKDIQEGQGKKSPNIY